jgi:hypothetical protein
VQVGDNRVTRVPLTTTRQRLHEARVLECLHLYLKQDGSGKEQQIPPVRTRGAQVNLVEA